MFPTTKHSTNPLAVKLTVTAVLLTMVHWRQTIRRNGRFWRTKDIKDSETMFVAFTQKGQSTHPRRSTTKRAHLKRQSDSREFFGRMCVYGAFVRRNSAGVNRFMTTSSK
ncbi:hypothetical protein GQ600_13820 [Phytophthora cactorum]|nr:hypothetical protein GQ600_13820 [Phytophthora cactorum]